MKHLESSESTQKKSQNDRLSSEIHTSAVQIRVFPREWVTLRVAQFVLKLAHLQEYVSCLCHTKIKE